MDLELFMANVLGKVIKIETMNSEGDLGLRTELTIQNAEIKAEKFWDGYTLTINDNINLYFEYWQVSQYDDCKNILNLYRSDQILASVCLPYEDSWDFDGKVGYLQY